MSFSKSGYQTFFHNSGSSVVLTNTVVLPTVLLSTGTASYVSGQVSGTWASNTTYFVQGNLQVPVNMTLDIQPGTEIRFLGNYSMAVNGALNAQGTAASPIRFFSADSTKPWGELNLYAGPNLIRNCLLRHYGSINNWNGTMTVSACSMRNCSIGVQLVGGNVLLENNEI